MNIERTVRLPEVRNVANPACEAFVFLGRTGDLAYGQILPALQAMIPPGRFDMPIPAVGRSAADLQALCARARRSLEART